MMRRWRWGVFGVVALGVGGMGVWAGAQLKDSFDPGVVTVVASDKEATAGPPPQDPVPPTETPKADKVGPVGSATKGEPTPAPVPTPVSPPPEAAKEREAKTPAPLAGPPPVDPKAAPVAPPPPVTTSPEPPAVTSRPQFPDPSPPPPARTAPAPQPPAPPPAAATAPKPPQPDFASFVPGTPGGPTPPPAPQPAPPSPAPTGALPPPPPASVAPAKFAPTPDAARTDPLTPSEPTHEENTKPNNIFRALPGSAEAAPASVPTNSPWTVQIKVVQGRTELEAHNGDKVHLRITCRQMQVQAPNGNIQALGDVKLSGSDLNGSCDLLTIIWQKEDVLMEGKVHLKCPKDAQEIDLTADRLSVKLTNAKTAKAIDRKESADILRAWTGFLPGSPSRSKP